jgi:4-diphosphocytidyl-2-C-methyl-D-erythritol kinase
MGADNKLAQGWDTVWPAPAKLNLCLLITGRREDGFHRLQTAFQIIDLLDYVKLDELPDGQFTLSGGLESISPDEDLCMKAARLLYQHCRPGSGAAITLQKNIPVGAGMGGGSSDAATTLLALNHLWQAGLPREELASIGLDLGADVPLFVHGQSAWGEELGEKLTPEKWPRRWFLVLNPGVSISTREIFSAPELTRNSTPITIRSFLKDGAGNDCELVVRSRYPEVDEALTWLSRFGRSRLTGTGSCVFSVFERRQDAEEVRTEVPEKWSHWLVRGLDASPANEVLENQGRGKEGGA